MRSNCMPPSVGRDALPAAVGLLRQRIEAQADIGRDLARMRLVAERTSGIERARDRQLLDQRAGIARRDRIQQRPGVARAVDNCAQIVAGDARCRRAISARRP